VDLKKKDGLRDYVLLHLLYDSGARASEVAMLKLDYLNAQEETLAICGKGNRYRIIRLEIKTVQLLQFYIKKCRVTPRPPYRDYLFISQRREALTRHGIYRVCRKYLEKALPKKRLKHINPVHSFRHSCAVRMLYRGESSAPEPVTAKYAPADTGKGNKGAAVGHLRDSIEDDTQPLVDVYEGARSIAVCDAMYQSSITGQPAKVVAL